MALMLLVGRDDAGYRYKEILERDPDQDLLRTSGTSSSSRAGVEDACAFEGV